MAHRQIKFKLNSVGGWQHMRIELPENWVILTSEQRKKYITNAVKAAHPTAWDIKPI